MCALNWHEARIGGQGARGAQPSINHAGLSAVQRGPCRRIIASWGKEHVVIPLKVSSKFNPPHIWGGALPVPESVPGIGSSQRAPNWGSCPGGAHNPGRGRVVGCMATPEMKRS